MFNNDDSATVFMPTSVSPASVGNAPPTPPPSSPKKSSKKTLLLSLIGLFILGGGIATALTLVSQRQDPRSRAAECNTTSQPLGALVCNSSQCITGFAVTLGGETRCANPQCQSGASGNPQANECLGKAFGESCPNTGGCCYAASFIGGIVECGCRACPGSGGGGGGGGGSVPPGGVCTPSNCDPTQSNICCPDNRCVKAWDGCGGGGGAPPPPPPKKVCGETCSATSDCASAATPGVTVICRGGFCENSSCPAGQTVFGANCACGAARQCGQTCGATVGAACAQGVCRYVNVTTPGACPFGWPQTYCVDTKNGYTTPVCTTGDAPGGAYLVGPSGKTSGFSQAEILASCGVGGANCPVGGTTGRKASCGGTCQADSDCRAPSGGGSAVCRSGVCENTACPTGKTLAGAACLCAGSALETQQCGQQCGSFGLCAPGQGVCRYINTGGNNCPWGWSQTYCVSTSNGFTTPSCAFGDTGGAYLVAPDGRSAGITLTELRQSCQACGDGIVQPGEDCDDGAANGTSASVCNTTCKATNCSLATPAPSPTPQPTPTPPPLIAQCQLIKMFDENWNALTLNELATFTAGRKVRFTVGGNTSSGTLDMARFTINGTLRPEVTSKRPNTDEFFDEFTIPTGTTNFSVNAQLHHSTLGWF